MASTSRFLLQSVFSRFSAHPSVAVLSCLALALALSACEEKPIPTSGGQVMPGTADHASHGHPAVGHAFALAVAPEGFVESTVVSGLESPTAMAFAPDGRIFVSEKAGRLRVVKGGALRSEPFLTVRVNAEGERGLLGLALDPDFAVTGHVYLYYTSTGSPRRNRISRFTASAADPDAAEAGSERVLLELDPLSSATNHNGGALRFGPDGMLYAAVGENAASEQAQSLENAFGKVLRIAPDGAIPSDNPFHGKAAGTGRAIWALGLRNPFSFAFQPGTGRMFINDVGWRSWEEINEGRAGANFGWPGTEGPTKVAGVVEPFHAYRNDRHPQRGGRGCAIVGAAFYNPDTARFPADFAGDYFFGDHCGGWIRRLDPATRTVSDFLAGVGGLTDIQVGADGGLYYLAYGSGLLRKVSYTGSRAPSISRHPEPATVTVGGSAVFAVSASGAQPFSYRWQRDGVDIPGADAAEYALEQAQRSDHGARFRCMVSNAHGSAASREAVLSVTDNRPPVAVITSPAGGAEYAGGQVFGFSGKASDPEDGALPPSAFTWRVDIHHEAHTHPLLGPVTGSLSGSLVIPAEGETSANVWLRVHLTVRDKDGLVHSVHADVRPVKSKVTLSTSPAGLTVLLDGSPFAAPHAFTGVAGMRRTLAAPSPQIAGGKTWEFVSWSDGGAAAHAIATPGRSAAYTAVFREAIGEPGAVHEAEDAAAMQGAEPRQVHSGFTGRAYVKYRAYRSWVEWEIVSAQAGPRTLEFRYAYGTPEGSALRVTVGGVVAAEADLPATGSWSSWSTVPVTVDLPAGATRVRARMRKGEYLLLDNLTVR